MDVSGYLNEWVNPETISMDKANPTAAVIKSSGEEIEGKFGTRFVLDIEIDGKKVKYQANKTSVKKIAEKYGVDSEQWIGKEIQLLGMFQMVSGIQRKTIFVV